MSSNVSNKASYLRTTRDFPKDIDSLVQELEKAYLDTANSVNTRTIGLHAVNKASVGGEDWYINSQKQQNLRQVYTFTAAGPIKHGLSFSSIERFTKCYGSFKDAAGNYNGVIFGTSTVIAGQVSFYITSNDIIVLNGGVPSAIVSGTIVLEWLSNV